MSKKHFCNGIVIKKIYKINIDNKIEKYKIHKKTIRNTTLIKKAYETLLNKGVRARTRIDKEKEN